MTRHKTRAARAAALPAALPGVPREVVERMQAHLAEMDFRERGLVAVMRDFYARLDAAGLPPASVTPEIYRSVATSRSRLRTLLWGLHAFAPDVPLAPAAEEKKRWDRWLNGRYGKKPRKPRASNRVGLPPKDWPASWPRPDILDRTVRPYRRPLRPLAPKTRETVVSAIGMLAASRVWAEGLGVVCKELPSADLFEVFERYLLLERAVSCRSAACYFERLEIFFLRAGLLDEATLDALHEIGGALAEAATDAVPSKRAVLRAFRQRFDLGDVLHTAVAAETEARTLPAQSTAALRLRQKALAYALLVNAGDRQGDLRHARVGIELVRDPNGTWYHDLRQRKTDTRKEMEALWPGTCALLDAHVLADRPSWQIADRLIELQGTNLLTLGQEVLYKGFLNRRLEEDFSVETADGITERLTGHLIRTLIVDAIRRLRPDAMWAAQHMLGHSDRWMQETYRSQFDASAAVQAMDARYGEIEAST